MSVKYSHDAGLCPFPPSLDLTAYEIVERRMVARYVTSGQLVLEGGAGIGSVTRVLLDAGARVVAYEPGREPFMALQRLASCYSLACQVEQQALALCDGALPLHVYEPWFASRTTGLGGQVPLRSEVVDARNLADELARDRYHGLVLDVEGAEHELLKSVVGMCSSTLRWIVAELHGEPTKLAQTLCLMSSSSWVLDAIEVHFSYLVAGWTKDQS